jgi:ADP-ribosylglycohydrolase
MLGAIAGDIIGSEYEAHPIKTTRFPLFSPRCRFTDDTVLTVALADAILHDKDYATLMKEYYSLYPKAGYGSFFHGWARSAVHNPYGSFGNGAAMRISPAGWAYDTLEEVLQRAKGFTEVTHNHPEGIKGAQATAAAVFLARSGTPKGEIRQYVMKEFGYDLSRPLDEIRPAYRFDVTCQGTVPQAITAFIESVDFEDAIRKAVSLGGDSDTLACITGGMAEAYYGDVPDHIAANVYDILDERLSTVTRAFRKTFLKK